MLFPSVSIDVLFTFLYDLDSMHFVTLLSLKNMKRLQSNTDLL